MYSQIVMAACLYLSLIYNLVKHNDPLSQERIKTSIALMQVEEKVQISATKMNKYITKIADLIDKDSEELDKHIDELNHIEDAMVLKEAGRGYEKS